MLTSPARVMQHIDPKGDEPHPLEESLRYVSSLIRYYASLARRKCTRDYDFSNTTPADRMPFLLFKGMHN